MKIFAMLIFGLGFFTLAHNEVERTPIYELPSRIYELNNPNANNIKPSSKIRFRVHEFDLPLPIEEEESPVPPPTISESVVKTCFELPEVDPLAFKIFRGPESNKFQGRYTYKYKQIEFVQVLSTSAENVELSEKETQREKHLMEHFATGFTGEMGGWESEVLAIQDLSKKAKIFMAEDKVYKCKKSSGR